MRKAVKKGKIGFKKKLVIISGSIIAFTLVLCLSGYVIINGYLDKVNYDPGTASVSAGAVIEPPEEVNPDLSDVMNKEVEETLITNSSPLMYDKDVYNILLIGSDSRVAGKGGRSDSMILISINKKTSKIIATSLLRDIYLKIPGYKQGDRLNAAYSYGGAALLLSTVQTNFKIQVDKYIAVDFFSFIDIIDKVGGVSVDLSEAEIDVANSYIYEINELKGLPQNDGILTLAGRQNLDGKQALGFSRIRYVGNADFGRTDRQRLVLKQVFSKLKKENFLQLTALLNTFLPKVTTNLSKGELFSLILSVPAYTKYTLDSWRIPVDGAFSFMSVRKMSVLKLDFDKNIAEMQRRIYK